MSATKTFVNSVAPGTTLAAGAVANGGIVPFSTYDFADAFISIANGSNAPTTACIATLSVSCDGATFYAIGQLSGGLAASTNIQASIPIPPSAQYASVSFSAPSGYGVTVGAQIGYGTF